MIDNKLLEQKYCLPSVGDAVKVMMKKESLPTFFLTGEIETVTDAGRLTLEIREERNNVPIMAGDSLLLEYPLNDGLYEAQCDVGRIEIGYDHAGRESVFFFLNSPFDLKRIQRRNRFRLPVSLPVSVRMATPASSVELAANSSDWIADSTEESGSTTIFSGQTINLSETGLCVAAKSDLAKGDEIMVEFELGGTQLTLPSRVMWSAPIECEEDYLYKAGIHFTRIRPKEEDLIGAFIFERQRKRLKKK